MEFKFIGITLLGSIVVGASSGFVTQFTIICLFALWWLYNKDDFEGLAITVPVVAGAVIISGMLLGDIIYAIA